MRKFTKLLLCALSMTAFAAKIIAKDKLCKLFRKTEKIS
ncbi:MAG: hypothetical protein XD78_0990 [Desulfotomaculum sp. 46_296]|nr:MAG: hypothetical protein XD78_0990 [Desulfotomaculum sp. 46_296]